MNNMVNLSVNTMKTNLSSTVDKTSAVKDISNDNVKTGNSIKNKKSDNSFKKVMDTKLKNNEKKPEKHDNIKEANEKEPKDLMTNDIKQKEIEPSSKEEKIESVEENTSEEQMAQANILEELLAYLLGQCDLDKVGKLVNSEETDMEQLLVLLNNENFSGNIEDFLSSLKGKDSEEVNKLLLMMTSQEENEQLLKSILDKVSVKDVFKNVLNDVSNKDVSIKDELLKGTEGSESSQGLKNFGVSAKETLLSSMETYDGTDNSESSFNKEEKLLLSLINDDKNTGKDIPKGLFSMVNGLSSRANLEQLNAVALPNIENPVINAANMPNDIIESIKFMDFNSLKELSIKIVPKELGEVFIKLTVEAGVMKANISAANKDTYSLLNANINDINQKLNEGNIKVSEVNINIYQDDTTYFSGEFQKQHESRDNNQNNNSKQGERTEAIELNESISETLNEDDSNVNILV